MLPPGLKTPREVSSYYDSLYDSLVSSGQAHPFLYPWATAGAFISLVYLLFDHRHNATLRGLRYTLFAAFSSFQIWIVATNRAKHPAAALGVGLLSSWGILWVSTIMLVNDCQTDFKRVERSMAQLTEDRNDESTMNGSARNGVLVESHLDATKDSKPTWQRSGLPNGSYVWQTYPESFPSRLDWIADAFCSFRGVGWNWQSTTVPPPPKAIGTRLQGKVENGNSTKISTSRVGIRRIAERDLLLQHTYKCLIVGYLTLDLIKILMHHDAYFWGYVDATPPAYLPTGVQNSHFLVKSYRLLIGLAGMYTALWEIFKLGPAFFCGILGPKWIGLRGEPWMNPPDMFGSFQCILDNGIAGWWGGWWHQTFRVAFEAHSAFLLKKVDIEKRSQEGQLISLLVAFFLSGCVHACGSLTMLGDTRPILGPMRFFLLQPLAIIVQMIATSQLSKAGVLQIVPKRAKQLANFVIVHAWLYFTAPLLVDDFAKGGVWLYVIRSCCLEASANTTTRFEPIALSPLRLLGLGAIDDRFFCWDGILAWRSGRYWWDTGIVL